MRWTAPLVVASMALGLASGQTCSGSFIPVGGECLAFLTSYGTWYNQLSACVMAPNASLAKVTGDLHNAIYEYIKDTAGLQSSCFWIGGSDRVMEGNWKWEVDGTEIPLGGPHWDPCEPEPNGGTTENFLALCPEMYYYKDFPGDRENQAICQQF